MADSKKPNQIVTHKTFNANKPGDRVAWFFYEYWPIIVPGSCFLLLCALPLTLSGMMHNPFSSADVVWSGYGLLLIAEFVVAVLVIALAPRFLGIYLLLLAIYSLIVAENGKAWTVGFVSDGLRIWPINVIAILFLSYVLVGNIVFMQACFSEKKRAL